MRSLRVQREAHLCNPAPDFALKEALQAQSPSDLEDNTANSQTAEVLEPIRPGNVFAVALASYLTMKAVALTLKRLDS